MTSTNSTTVPTTSIMAQTICALLECSPRIQEIVAELAKTISDPSSDDDERAFAGEAIIQALFPGKSHDNLVAYRSALATRDALNEQEYVREESLTFARLVRRFMEERNVTQETLADAAGITQPAVSNLLNRNCRPQRRTIVRFAKALQVRPVDLWPSWMTTKTTPRPNSNTCFNRRPVVVPDGRV